LAVVTASRISAVALIVIAARLVLGVWPTSLLLAAGCVWWLLWAWHRIENRTRRRGSSRALVPRVGVQADRPGSGHVVFARALASVALAYLDRCEQEADQP
jgi:hypothetical protein